MTKNMIRDFFKWTQFSIIQQSLVISVQNVSPPATAFVSSGHCIRLLQPLHLTSSAIAFVSFSHRSRMCQLNEVDEVVK